MPRTKSIFLVVLVAVVAIAATAILLGTRPALLYLAKREAHRSIAKLSPEEIRRLDTVPAAITLPAPGSGAITAVPFDGYTLVMPQPVSNSIAKSSLIFMYPQFTVQFLKPFSTTADDAAFQKLVHKDWFLYTSDMYHTRVADIDAQTDTASVKLVATLLLGKPVGAALDTYFAQFDGPNRRGFIMAVSTDRHRFHAVVDFPKTTACCGMYFSNSGGVSPFAVQQFLATLQIERQSETAPGESSAPTSNPGAVHTPP